MTDAALDAGHSRGRLAPKPATVAFDRICLGNGIRHLLTAPYSPTTTGKIERLHKTMRKELFDGRRFASIEQAQTDLDAWVVHYNHERGRRGTDQALRALRACPG